MMRQPGDYVVSAELTDEQRDRFVQDCVAAGAKDDSGDAKEYELTLWDNDYISDVSGYPSSCMTSEGVNNVTHEYKENTMTQPQLMRQIADAMERNPDGWPQSFQVWAGRKWHTCEDPEEVFDFAEDAWHRLRPKPRTYTLHVEDMPEPLRDIEIGQTYWRISVITGIVIRDTWEGVTKERKWLRDGLCHPDEPTAREALEKLTKAMGGE